MRLHAHTRLGANLMLVRRKHPCHGRERHRGCGCTEGRYSIVDVVHVPASDPAGTCIGLQERELPMHATTPLRVELIVLQVVANDGVDNVLNPYAHPEVNHHAHRCPPRRQHVCRPRGDVDGPEVVLCPRGRADMSYGPMHVDGYQGLVPCSGIYSS